MSAGDHQPAPRALQELDRRDRALVMALSGVAVLAALLAIVGFALPTEAERIVGGTAVGVVAGGPLLRLVWVAGRWRRERDWRFVGVAAALLCVIAIGALVALAV